jgi:CRP/FNR family nitrogen fixation transcriptional regulator
MYARSILHESPIKSNVMLAITAPIHSFDSAAMIKKGQRGQEISSQCAGSAYFFFVRSGLVRKFAIQPDGHRRIIDLLMPGDILSLDSIRDDPFILEAAVDDTVVVGYTRRRIEEMISAEPEFGRDVRDMVLQSLSRLERQLLIVGRITAIEKVAGFLLEFASRIGDGHSNRITLPITRYDIADCIGVSSETVCRSMTELTRRGAIALPHPREVKIIDRSILDDME